MNDELRLIKVALLISGLMLCLAVLPVWPYGYYSLLRLIVCGTSGYAAYFFLKDAALQKHFIPLVLTAIVFNPFSPVYFERIYWIAIDLGAALYFLSIAKKIQLH